MIQMGARKRDEIKILLFVMAGLFNLQNEITGLLW